MRLIEVVDDIRDCRRALIEVDGHGTWVQAWQLHRARIQARRFLTILKEEER